MTTVILGVPADGKDELHNLEVLQLNQVECQMKNIVVLVLATAVIHHYGQLLSSLSLD
jgi:hypothetical protein